MSKKTEVLDLLKGLVCLYKPPDVGLAYVKYSFRNKICAEMNKLYVAPPIDYISVSDSESGISIDIRPSFEDNVLATGPKYTHDDICLAVSSMGTRSAGVCGVNEGIGDLKIWANRNPLKILHVKGMLGQATQYFYKNEKVIARAKYHKLQRSTFEKVINSFQAAHQRKIFTDLKLDIQSQEAYEFAVRGMPRPLKFGNPCIYNMKLIELEPPHFTLEIACINENEAYLLQLIHDLGLQLRTFAHCTGIHRIRHGSFTLKDALVKSQISVNNVIDNMNQCKRLWNKDRLKTKSKFLRPASESQKVSNHFNQHQNEILCSHSDNKLIS